MAEWLNLADVLQQKREPLHPIAQRDETLLTHAQFVVAQQQWLSKLADLAGQRVALFHDDAWEFAAALFACWRLHCVVVLAADNLPRTVDQLRPSVAGFIGSWPSASGVDQIAIEIKELKPMAVAKPTADALIVFTSGSTGEPSAITKQFHQLSSELQNLEHCFGQVLADAPVQCTVSHQHLYGFLFGVLWPLCAGRRFAVSPLRYPEQIAQAGQQQPVVLVSSPAHLKRLPEHLEWDSAQPRFKAVFSSGGPLPAEAVTLSERCLKQTPIEVYGSSETGGIAWRQRFQAQELPWQTLPNVSVQIDPETQQLQVRSPHLPDQSWWQTADCVRFTEAGFFVTGRADRIVKIEEKRISLSSIEAALCRSEYVSEARAVAIEGSRDMIAVLAVLTADGAALLMSKGKRVLNQTLVSLLRSQIESVALPRRWRYVATLPVNALGKTTQRDLLEALDPRQPDIVTQHCSEHSANLTLRFSNDSPYFDGHFPGQPVLPGIAAVNCTLRIAKNLFAINADFQRMDNLKFPQLIQAGQLLDLQLKWSAERALLDFTLRSDRGVHATGRLQFATRVHTE